MTTTNYGPQFTENQRHVQTTRPIILQPNIAQSATIRTLTRRTQLICDSPDTLRHENDYLQRVFDKNNYNSDFINLKTYKDSERNETNNPTTTTAKVRLR